MTVLAALRPEVARTSGENARSKESSALAIHSVPAESKARALKANRVAFDVVTVGLVVHPLARWNRIHSSL